MKTFTFLTLWLVVFAISYIGLSLLDMVPLEMVEINARLLDAFSLASSTAMIGNSGEVVEVSKGASPAFTVHEKVLPQHITIEKIGVNAPIVNPENRDITVLDQALLTGVVRFPGSGGLDDESNMLLFGHSTSFRTVHNSAFKSFNRLGELQIGDSITIQSGDLEYRYKVVTVKLVDKNRELVEFATGEKRITLSTCDTFGERSDRFVVEAQFLQTVPLSPPHTTPR